MPITSRSTHSLCCSAVDAATTPHDDIPTWHSVAAESDALQTRPLRSSLSPTNHTRVHCLSVLASLSVLFLSLCGVPEDSRPRHTLLSPRYHTLSRHTLTQSAIGLDSRHRLTHHHLFFFSLPRYASSPGTYASTRLHPSTSLLSSSRARHSSGLATRTNTRSVSSPSPCDAPTLPIPCVSPPTRRAKTSLSTHPPLPSPSDACMADVPSEAPHHCVQRLITLTTHHTHRLQLSRSHAMGCCGCTGCTGGHVETCGRLPHVCGESSD